MENEMNAQRAELRELEKRIAKREDGLDHKVDLLNKKEHYIESLERSLALKRKEISAEQAELEQLMEQEKVNLHKISELSKEDATSLLHAPAGDGVAEESAEMIARYVADAKENASARRVKSWASPSSATPATTVRKASSLQSNCPATT